VWRKLASWMRDRDGCNPDKDIIDILPGANWCGTCYRSKPTAALRYSSDIRVSPMQDREGESNRQSSGDLSYQNNRRVQLRPLLVRKLSSLSNALFF